MVYSLSHSIIFWERQRQRQRYDIKTMSEKNEAENTPSCCASCGIAEIDDIKLMPCDDCDLVKYCSDECQEVHASSHEEECKERAAELRDELLFKQPESTHLGDCPICCLPMPLDVMKSTINTCCSKTICNGCVIANRMQETEMGLHHSCPFCREQLPVGDEECKKQNMKRIEMNDPAAMCYEGVEQHKKGNYSRAFEYWTKAAELGNVEAHARLADVYYHGDGVEKDGGKYVHHLKQSAIGGHPRARHNLGGHDWNNGNYERAVEHFIIAATQGYDESVKMLMRGFKVELVPKNVLAAALRAHQAAVDETKSPQREAAEAYYREYNGQQVLWFSP